MTNHRSDLTRMIREASGGAELVRAVAALDEFDTAQQHLAAQERDTDLGAVIAARRLTPVTAHEHHTAATDWLGEYDEGDRDYRTAMIAQASTWYRGLDPAVRADGQELIAQASGRAHTLASAFGSKHRQAATEFMSVIGYLHAQGASGLPQIDQTVDANNSPSATPYPTEVFPTFAPDQDPYNAGIEGMNHDSQVDSMHAPLIQQVMQQQNGGSGFGTGPEKPDMHSTGDDFSGSYAEVPLGEPGTLPTAPAATDQGKSTPNPVAGTDQDAGADRRVAAVVAGYSLPDPFGYRWPMQSEVMHPFHERCAAGHWPDEACTPGIEATASVAVGYTMNLEQARRLAQAEAVGVQEGIKALAAAQSVTELGSAHNRFTAAWGQSDRELDDTAVLHGFMAVVRPVLAELATEACKGGDCASCSDPDCGCARHPKGRTAAKVRSYVTAMRREYAAAGEDTVMIKHCDECGKRHDVLKDCPAGKDN